MLRLFVFAALSLMATAHAQAQAILQKSFYGDSSGTYVNKNPATGCQLVPRNCNVSLDGGDGLPILVNPWEPVSINIICAQVIFLPSRAVAPNTIFFAGNSFSPDIMAWGVPKSSGAGSARMCYPAGTWFAFPAAAKGASPNNQGQNDFTLPHLDVHVIGGPATVSYSAYLSVWYTKNQQ
jgi:hypothetical protein